MPFGKKNAAILVVDDEIDAADTLAEQLNLMGYRVQAVYSGTDALEKLEQQPYDVMITDLKMPGMDGLELLEAALARDPKMMIMMISGYGTIDIAVTAIKKGAFDFIQKPCKADEVELRVRRALERKNIFEKLGLFRGITLAMVIALPFLAVLVLVIFCLWK